MSVPQNIVTDLHNIIFTRCCKHDNTIVQHWGKNCAGYVYCVLQIIFQLQCIGGYPCISSVHPLDAIMH